VNAIVDAAPSDAAILALALAASPKHADARSNAAALAALPLVVRTASQLCQFAGHIDNVRGWGRALRSAIDDWYASKPVAQLAAEMLKTRTRDAWSHREVLRAAHSKARTSEHNLLFRWVIDGEIGTLAPDSLRQISGFELARKAATASEIAGLIEDYGLTVDMIPSVWKRSAQVWEALLPGLSYSSLLKNLGRMTACGFLAPQSSGAAITVARLMSRSRIRTAQLHPITLLAASRSYIRGRSESGLLRWTPVTSVADALDEAFHIAFENVVPAGQRVYVWLESDQWTDALRCHGFTCLAVSRAASALALSFERAEPSCTLRTGVDPFQDALRRELEVDAFVLLTSFGASEAAVGMDQYRHASGLDSKLVVIAASAEQLEGADDSLRLDVAGVDANMPGVVHKFLTEGL
jgi:60 kDa SS-A/Ro ribonucleoprotein